MNKKYDELIKYVKQTEALSHASGLIAWDQETMMPKGSVLQRADCLASLESEIHKRKSNKIISDLLGEVNTTNLNQEQNSNIYHIERSFLRASKIPNN